MHTRNVLGSCIQACQANDAFTKMVHDRAAVSWCVSSEALPSHIAKCHSCFGFFVFMAKLESVCRCSQRRHLRFHMRVPDSCTPWCLVLGDGRTGPLGSNHLRFGSVVGVGVRGSNTS